MKNKKANLGWDVVEMERTFSSAAWWDDDGRCWERVNDGPETRRPDLDFGTPNGDLIIDPWIQDLLKPKA